MAFDVDLDPLRNLRIDLEIQGLGILDAFRRNRDVQRAATGSPEQVLVQAEPGQVPIRMPVGSSRSSAIAISSRSAER